MLSQSRSALCRLTLRSFAAGLMVSCTLAIPAMGTNVDVLGRNCNSGKQKACEELAKIATLDKNSNKRQHAVQELTDQTLLASIAMQDAANFVRQAAVEKLNDQTALVQIAVKQTDVDITRAALKKLTGQSQLLEVALEAAVSEVRSAAALRLTNQSLLSRVAIEDTDAKVRATAVDLLTDQSFLGTVAGRGKDQETRMAALWKLTDRAFLSQMATNDPDQSFRDAARLAADWKSVQAERDVYVWKQPSDNSTSGPKPRWRISGIIGGSPFEFSTAASVASGFKIWQFQPENDKDSFVLESGTWSFSTSGGQMSLTFGPGSSWSQTIGGNQNTLTIPLRPPTAFTRRTEKGSNVWAVVESNSVLIYDPEVYVSRNGTLEMGGLWKKVVGTLGQPGSALTASRADAVPVEIVGTIRFPSDHWTQVGAAFEIMGGGLQFDGSSVFLSVGTQYRTRAQ